MGLSLLALQFTVVWRGVGRVRRDAMTAEEQQAELQQRRDCQHSLSNAKKEARFACVSFSKN